MATPRNKIPLAKFTTIAEEVIGRENQPTRSQGRPASKVYTLRKLMAADKVIEKRVHEMYRAMQMTAISKEMKQAGMKVETATPAHDDGNEEFILYPFQALIQYTAGGAGLCHECKGAAVIWYDGKRYCTDHRMICAECHGPAQWFGGGGTQFFCDVCVPEPVEGTFLFASEESFFKHRNKQ